MSLFPPPESPDLTKDVQQLLADLDRDLPGGVSGSAVCRPPADVYETASALEVLVDLPGVSPDSVRVAVRGNRLIVVGAKRPGPSDPEARFHLAERGFGRFARVVPLDGAVDATRATAVVRIGQLHVALPRIDDRRGRLFIVPVERA